MLGSLRGLYIFPTWKLPILVSTMKNGDLKLEADVRELLEQELNRDVPDPNSAEFQSFLEELQAERPDLFDEVMRGLHVNVVLPAEAQAQQAERRETVQSTVRRAFFRRSQVDGEPVTAKRRLMAYVLGALALLLPLSYIIGQVLSSTGPVIDGQVATSFAPESTLPEPPTTALATLPPAEPESEEPDPPEEPVAEVPEAPAAPVRATPAPRLPPPPRQVRASAPPAPQATPAPPTPAPSPPTAPAPPQKPSPPCPLR